MKLQLICRPPSEFDHPEKGDALYGMSYFVHRARIYSVLKVPIKREIFNKV